ncbi:MAG: hypothetical protein JOZ38_08565 [Candidatus Eremiobacteraeota bacterium]|nr:hypothetical protein [Candidatus Eremiobacteraeota bacterium]
MYRLALCGALFAALAAPAWGQTVACPVCLNVNQAAAVQWQLQSQIAQAQLERELERTVGSQQQTLALRQLQDRTDLQLQLFQNELLLRQLLLQTQLDERESQLRAAQRRVEPKPGTP